MKWILIRHGQTQGNLERRYIGSGTDEPLCAQGIASLERRTYPQVRRVLVSPMKRCIETARLIYPQIDPEIVENLCECDFGAFENKSYAELSGRRDYQAWIDSGGEMPFPGGESRADFAARCVAAFERLDALEDAALVVHGGTIMAIMERFASPKGSYYDFQVRNGEGYALYPDGRYERI